MNSTIIFLYFILLFLIASLSIRTPSKPETFYISSRRASTIAVTGSLFATIIGSSAILGTISLSYRIGWAACWLMGSASIGLLLTLFFLKRIRERIYFTLPDLLEHFYGTTIKKIASLIIPIAWSGIIAAQIIGGAKILSWFFPWSFTNCAFLFSAIVIGYTMIAGQVSVIKTDVFQALILIAGFILLFFFRDRTASSLSMMSSTTHGFPFNKNFSPLDLFVLFMTYSLTFTTGPDIYSRLFCAKSDAAARRSLIGVAILLLPLGFLFTSMGISSQNFPSSFSAGSLEGFHLMIKTALPPWAYSVIILTLLSAIISSADTTLLSAASISCGIFHDLQKTTSVRITRWLLVFIGLISTLIAIWLQSIINALLWGLTVFSGGFTFPILLGLLGWRVHKTFCVLAISWGTLFAFYGKILSMQGHAHTGTILILAGLLGNFIILFAGQFKKNPIPY